MNEIFLVNSSCWLNCRRRWLIVLSEFSLYNFWFRNVMRSQTFWINTFYDFFLLISAPCFIVMTRESCSKFSFVLMPLIEINRWSLILTSTASIKIFEDSTHDWKYQRINFHLANGSASQLLNLVRKRNLKEWEMKSEGDRRQNCIKTINLNFSLTYFDSCI